MGRNDPNVTVACDLRFVLPPNPDFFVFLKVTSRDVTSNVKCQMSNVKRQMSENWQKVLKNVCNLGIVPLYKYELISMNVTEIIDIFTFFQNSDAYTCFFQ